MLTALANGRPDRLPCQVHGWMDYYLDHYLGGMDWWQVFERFGLDFAIYVEPVYEYGAQDSDNWRVEHRDLGADGPVTPGGPTRSRRRKASCTRPGP